MLVNRRRKQRLRSSGGHSTCAAAISREKTWISFVANWLRGAAARGSREKRPGETIRAPRPARPLSLAAGPIVRPLPWEFAERKCRPGGCAERPAGARRFSRARPRAAPQECATRGPASPAPRNFSATAHLCSLPGRSPLCGARLFFAPVDSREPRLGREPPIPGPAVRLPARFYLPRAARNFLKLARKFNGGPMRFSAASIGTRGISRYTNTAVSRPFYVCILLLTLFQN